MKTTKAEKEAFAQAISERLFEWTESNRAWLRKLLDDADRAEELERQLESATRVAHDAIKIGEGIQVADEANAREVSRLTAENTDLRDRLSRAVGDAIATDNERLEALEEVSRLTAANRELERERDEARTNVAAMACWRDCSCEARKIELKMEVVTAANREMEKVVEAARNYQCEWCKQGVPLVNVMKRIHAPMKDASGNVFEFECSTPGISDALAFLDAARGGK